MGDEFNEILSRLGRMEGKQDAALEAQLRIDEHITKHDERLRHVERNQSRLAGWGAGALAVWTFIVSYIKLGG